MTDRPFPTLAAPGPTRSLPPGGRKRPPVAVMAVLALLAFTSPSDAKSFLETLFGPPKIQTRTNTKALPAFLRALFSPFQQPRRRVVSRARHRPAPMAQRALTRRPATVVHRAMTLRTAWAAPDRWPRRASLRVDRTRVGTMTLPAHAPLESEPVLPVEGIAATFLRDATLRRGDIVVFPEGPRVFNGSRRNKLHRLSDFEDLDASPLVSERTREHVSAATGAAPADATALSFTAKPSNLREASADLSDGGL